MSKGLILVVEDDPHIRLGLRESLAGGGYEVAEYPDGRQVIGQIKKLKPDLVLLDVMLPGASGYDVCRALRAERIVVPVIFVTAKGQELDKVLGLKLGADDYIGKPFGVQELLARVEALLRRTRGDGAAAAAMPAEIRFGRVRIQTAALRGTRADRAIELSARELKVLALLVGQAGNVVDRNRLLNEVWGKEYYGTTRTLDQVIVKLRRKLEDDPAHPRHILTVHGVGYRFEP